MIEIKDFEGYLRRMQNGMDDKLWWVPLSDHKTIVDYGCADGTLLRHIREIHPDYNLIGVDISPDMLRVAKATVPNCTFMTVDEFFACGRDFSDAILILSSVIHEIYSYCPDAEDVMHKLLTKGFAAIAIRDMCVSDNTEGVNVDYATYKLVAENTDYKMVADFARYYGYPYSQKQFVHYLLKYRYLDNWEREVAENYLPVNLEPLLNMLSEYYQIERLHHYTLPFLQECIRNDFGFELRTPTHVKILLTAKDGGNYEEKL